MQHADTGKVEVFDASQYKVGIAVSRFNNKITKQLLASARSELERYRVHERNTDIIYVDGSVELPLVLQQLARSKKYNCLVAIGAVIKGETAHFDYVCKFVTEGILRVQLDESVPIGYGILTCSTEKQAQARVGLGAGYAAAALHTAHSLESL